MENKETVFLAKIQLLINTFDEIDKIIEDLPGEHQLVDYEISDYLHLLQNEDLNDNSMLEISKKLKDARIRRNQLNGISFISKAYVDNKSKLPYANNRYCMENAIKKVVDRLNQNYNYRILDDTDISKLINITEKSNDNKVTKEKLESMINNGMKTKEIAEYFGKTMAYISQYKKKYGIATRKYTKRS